MESNFDELILKKQDLLKTEIIDNNYDKQAFLDFCISKKENGDDLDCWTLEELKSIIEDFKFFQSQENKKQEKVELKKDEEIKVEVEKIKIYVNFT
jgi:hypothetical protein